MKTNRQLLVLAMAGLLALPLQAAHAERVSSGDVTFDRPATKPAAKPKPATPAPAPAETSADQDYDICLELAADAPQNALDYAQSWLEESGNKSLAAIHCKALALSGLGRDEEAAEALSAVALGMDAAPKPDRAEAYAQAADGWLIAGNLKRARAAIDQALALDPIVDHLMARAGIRAAAKDWAGVRDDTSEVLAEAPTSPDALALRATAMRNLGEPQVALEDATRAVEIAPHNLNALLERGRSKAALLDMTGARADWKQVVALATDMGRTDDPRAAAARDFLKVGRTE